MAGRKSTQETPQGHQVPVPKRRDVLADLRKVAKTDKPSDASAGSPKQK
jgi:hypothetical protein